MIRKLLGIAPSPTDDGAYGPSPVALKLATSSKTDFDNRKYNNAYRGKDRRVLMVCTEERNLTMSNGKKFSTGNHPVEMLVPILHLKNAGFEIDIYTPTGKPVKIEMWAMPENDRYVTALFSELEEHFLKPRDLSEFVNNYMHAASEYVAVFIPGGHGALLGLPENEDVGRLIHWARKKDLFMLTICHGPAALLAANIHSENDLFIYSGYKIAAFPDSVDRLTPLIGYMPGYLTWKFGERLRALGITIVNKRADKTCHVDRKLISGASPDAANDFGILCAESLLREYGKAGKQVL